MSPSHCWTRAEEVPLALPRQPISRADQAQTSAVSPDRANLKTDRGDRRRSGIRFRVAGTHASEVINMFDDLGANLTDHRGGDQELVRRRVVVDIELSWHRRTAEMVVHA